MDKKTGENSGKTILKLKSKTGGWDAGNWQPSDDT
jgi:hypothetical protein